MDKDVTVDPDSVEEDELSESSSVCVGFFRIHLGIFEYTPMTGLPLELSDRDDDNADTAMSVLSVSIRTISSKMFFLNL